MSVRPADIRAHLQRLLGEEAVQLDRLHALLKDESTVLRGEDVGAIERIGADRHDTTGALTRLDGERRELCRMLDHGKGREGFEKLLAWCDAGGELDRMWRANLERARRCQEQNDRNGAVVTARLSHVHKMLGVLRGSSQPGIYAPRGQAPAFATRELGCA